MLCKRNVKRTVPPRNNFPEVVDCHLEELILFPKFKCEVLYVCLLTT